MSSFLKLLERNESLDTFLKSDTRVVDTFIMNSLDTDDISYNYLSLFSFTLFYFGLLCFALFFLSFLLLMFFGN